MAARCRDLGTAGVWELGFRVTLNPIVGVRDFSLYEAQTVVWGVAATKLSLSNCKSLNSDPKPQKLIVPLK